MSVGNVSGILGDTSNNDTWYVRVCGEKTVRQRKQNKVRKMKQAMSGSLLR